jgi:hypothetical protein
MDLQESSIKSLPEGLEVNRDVYLQYSSVKALPKGLKVGRDIHIFRTKLARYSDEKLRIMIEPGFIKGSIIRI